jgi:DNA-directed RNA polymerase specialized sigma subunit
MENGLRKIFTGLSIVDGALMKNDPNTMAAVLLGRWDHELSCALFHTLNGREANSEQELLNKDVVAALSNLKDRVRYIIQGIFELAAKEDARKSEVEMQELRKSLAQTNQPHELGTVAEIAQRYGISKSEVRRRKAEGTLQELKVSSSTTP